MSLSAALAPADLGARVVRLLSDDLLGEVLRALFFQGEGYGCYQTFEPHPDAVPRRTPWCREFWLGTAGNEWVDEASRMSVGFVWPLGGLEVDVCWYWDRDGTLSFRVRHEDRVCRWITNADCKKDHGWESEFASEDDVA